MRFRCHRKRFDRFASILPFWCVFDCPHENDRIARWDDVSWTLNVCYAHGRRFHFDAFSTVHTNQTICARIRFHPLSIAFSKRCVFDENAQRTNVDRRHKRIEMCAFSNENTRILPVNLVQSRPAPGSCRIPAIETENNWVHSRNWDILPALSICQNWPLPTSQFENEMVFFSKGIFYVYIIYWCRWIVLIESEILITTGVVWPVSSDKWEAPLQLLPTKPQCLKAGFH